MNYYEVTFSSTPPSEICHDVLASLLGEIGFESFTETEDGNMSGYIPEKLFDAKKIINVIENFPMDAQIEHQTNLIVSQNWNEEWEKHFFQPILIEDECVIHSSFHKDIPQVKYDIVIDPKMAFGTGHHETTSLMLSLLLTIDLAGKSFLDMGCGTAVLAILASMKGADPILAIDNDEWAYNNSVENVQLNNTQNIQVQHGDADLLGETSFNVIFANINRNILLNDICRYAGCLLSQGELYMSGFYTEDMPIIQEECEKNGLIFDSFISKNNWVAVKFTKR